MSRLNKGGGRGMAVNDSAEHIEYLKAKIRNILILKNNKVSSNYIASKIGVGVKLTNTLLKDILKEDAEYEQSAIKSRVAHSERKLDSFDQKLFEMVFSRKGDKIPWRYKLSAIKQLRENEKLRWNILFDSGMFRRELGNQSITEEETATLEEFLNYLIDNAPDEEFTIKVIELTSRFLETANIEDEPAEDPMEKELGKVQS